MWEGHFILSFNLNYWSDVLASVRSILVVDFLRPPILVQLLPQNLIQNLDFFVSDQNLQLALKFKQSRSDNLINDAENDQSC